MEELISAEVERRTLEISNKYNSEKNEKEELKIFDLSPKKSKSKCFSRICQIM